MAENPRKVLVTGATGRIGRSTIAALLHGHGLHPRALVRDPAAARASLPAGVDVAVGDFGDPESLRAALDGIDAVLIVSPVDPDQRRLQINVARAAATSGNPLIVKISGLGTALDSKIDSGRWHAETEADIRDLGLPFTFLRPLFFMQNLGFQIDGARRDGVIRAGVEDARIAMVDVEDVAGVCARLLAGDADLTGRAEALTGREALSYFDVAERMSRALGRAVAYRPQTLAEVRAALAGSGQPQWHIEILLQFNQAFREGLGEATSTTVEDVLGRAPRTLDDYLSGAVSDAASGSERNPFPS